MEPPFAEHSKEKIFLCQPSLLPAVAASCRVRLPTERLAETFERFDPFDGAKAVLYGGDKKAPLRVNPEQVEGLTFRREKG